MKTNKKATYVKWLKKADEDERSAEWLLKEEKGAPSTVCFLAQQIAEKNLKALMDFHGQEVKKTHDLIALESLLSKSFPKIEDLHENYKFLNTLYIESRYPGDLEFTWSLAKKALQSANEIKTFILSKFNE